MSSTRNLQASLLWALGFIRFRPVTIGGQEPALNSANLVLQTILGAPFAWRFNRGATNFLCVQTTPPTQDYTAFIPDFGFIEKAWVTTPGNTDRKEMEIKTVLAGSYESSRPMQVAPQSDDNIGDITFRLMPPPDAAYRVDIAYQRKAPLLTSICCLWSPLPDEMSYIYDLGFLTLLSFYAKDERAQIWNQKFMSHLLGAQEGLDELQRNIFIGNWLDITKAMERASLKTQQGITARGF